MTTRKTTKGYKVTVDFDQWQEKFDYYEDVLVCFKPVLRGYDLDNVTGNFKLDELEIDFLLGKISKKQLKDERCWHDESYFNELENYKKNYQVVWLSIGEHSQFSVWYGDDWVMLVEKDATPEFIHELVKELESWFNWRIYRVDIYEPQKFTSEDTEDVLIYWNYVDGQGGYFNLDEIWHNLPDYVGEIRKDTENETSLEFERC